jgi:hypothetical protein
MPDQTDYPNLRKYLDPKYQGLSDQRLETLLRRQSIDAESMEGFFDDLGKFAASAGKAVLKAAPSILPVAGQVVGTAFGGPVGAAIGGSLGSLAGQAVGAATGQKPSPGGGGAGGFAGILGGLGGLLGGSSAAGQMLQTVLKPQTMQALGSMALGAMGNPNVSVGGTPVPVGAFGNLLKVLAGRMEAEYNAVTARGEAAPEWLQDYSGFPKTRVDPAQSEARAAELLEMLEASEAGESEQESEAEGAEAEASMVEQEMAIQAEYDAIELAEVYESEEV